MKKQGIYFDGGPAPVKQDSPVDTPLDKAPDNHASQTPIQADPQPQTQPQAAEADEPQVNKKDRPEKKTKPKRRPVRVLLTILYDLIIISAVLFITYQFVWVHVATTHSMENTIHQNDVLLVFKRAYTFSTPQYDDIVLFRTSHYSGYDSEPLVFSRVIGLPGDHISIQNGNVYRNGMLLDDSYANGLNTDDNMSDLLVKQDSYFLLGDNRSDARDSRSDDIGMVEKDRILGRVISCVYPLSEIRKL